MLWTNLGVQKIKNTPMLHSSYIYNLAAKGSYRQIDMLGGGGGHFWPSFFSVCSWPRPILIYEKPAHSLAVVKLRFTALITTNLSDPNSIQFGSGCWSDPIILIGSKCFGRNKVVWSDQKVFNRIKVCWSDPSVLVGSKCISRIQVF